MKNIVLIGMPGVGKSTVGVLLAKALGCSFVDTDIILQTESGRKPADILKAGGAAEFFRLENAVLENLNAENSVVATGGSAVFCESGMRKLKENGIVVYLRLPLDELARRLNDIKTRGVVMNEGETLAEIERQRAPRYEQYADVIVDEQGDAKCAVEAVLRAVEKIAFS